MVYARVLPLSKRDEENEPRKEVAKVESVKKKENIRRETREDACVPELRGSVRESSISGGVVCLSLSL